MRLLRIRVANNNCINVIHFHMSKLGIYIKGVNLLREKMKNKTV